MSHALVLGATGLVGSHLLQQLLDDDHCQSVTALSRRPLPIEHPKLKVALCDFDQLVAVAGHPSDVRRQTSDANRQPPTSAVAPADDGQNIQQPFSNIDTVFCCLGTTIKQAGSAEAFRRVDHDYVVSAARLARAAGVKHFLLVSAINANADSRLLYSRTKGEAEQALRGLAFPALTIARPSLLVGERQESRPGERAGILVTGLLKPLFSWSGAGWLPVHAGAVAAAMLAAANNPDAAGVRVLKYRDF